MIAPPPIPAAVIERCFDELTDAQRAHVRACLGFVPGDVPGENDILWRRYEDKELSMITMQDEHDHILAGVFCGVESRADGSLDFVLCSAFSLIPEQNITATAFPQFEAMARKLGCSSMSLRTCRPGLALKLERQGWFCSELVLRKKLN